MPGVLDFSLWKTREALEIALQEKVNLEHTVKKKKKAAFSYIDKLWSECGGGGVDSERRRQPGKKKKNRKEHKEEENDRMTEGRRDLRSIERCQQPSHNVWETEYTT